MKYVLSHYTLTNEGRDIKGKKIKKVVWRDKIYDGKITVNVYFKAREINSVQGSASKKYEVLVFLFAPLCFPLFSLSCFYQEKGEH